MKVSLMIHSFKKKEQYRYIKQTHQIIRKVNFIHRKTLAKKQDIKNQNYLH